MGNKYQKPDPLILARQGDESALEAVLGNVLAPVFDVALHWTGDPKRAESATVATLRWLRQQIEAGGPEPYDAVTCSLRQLVSQEPGSNQPTTSRAHPLLLDLPEDQWKAVLLAHVAGLEGEELHWAATGDATVQKRPLHPSFSDSSGVQDHLDTVGAAVLLPYGMVDRALET